MDEVNMFGVRISLLKKTEVIAKIHDFLSSGRSRMLFTPNPEMLVDAHRYKEMRDILNSSDINICDGFGITVASVLSKNMPTIPRYAGSDCMLDICQLAEEIGKSIFLLGTGNSKTLENTRLNLKKKFPDLTIAGSHTGAVVTRLNGDTLFATSNDENEKVIDAIIDVAPDILFVGFGHGKQEWWIQRYLAELPSVKLAMGVGGSIDFIAGNISRAPFFLRNIGLEWLWRLLLQPWRFPRIIKATIIFPYLYFFKNDNDT